MANITIRLLLRANRGRGKGSGLHKPWTHVRDTWFDLWERPSCWMALSADQGSSIVRCTLRRWFGTSAEACREIPVEAASETMATSFLPLMKSAAGAKQRFLVKYKTHLGGAILSYPWSLRLVLLFHHCKNATFPFLKGPGTDIHSARHNSWRAQCVNIFLSLVRSMSKNVFSSY